jgi:ABC-type Fe3+/spermidine/putrescine transport system ATPase subunit
MAQPEDNDVVLTVSGLTKSYGDLIAVEDLSLDILRGEIFGFLGLSPGYYPLGILDMS